MQTGWQHARAIDHQQVTRLQKFVYLPEGAMDQCLRRSVQHQQP